jgi:Ca2+-dependent lipid-binding protein
MAFPSYSSSTVRSRKTILDEIGDCFVRELDFSKITLRLREKGDKSDEKKDHTIGKLTGNTLDTLKQCLVSPSPKSYYQLLIMIRTTQQFSS